MYEIQLSDAENALSDVVDKAVAGEPAVIVRQGVKLAVVLSWEAYQRISSRHSLGWLISNSPLDAGDLAERRPPVANS